VLHLAAQRQQLLVGGGELALGHERQPAHVVPRADQERARGRRLALLQDGIPLPEASHRPVGNDAEAGRDRHLGERLVVDLGGDLPRRVERGLALAVGRRGKPQEVDVVRVVGHGVHALGPALRDVALVGLHRQLVALHRVGIAPDPLIDVRRHVDHVPGVGQQRQQRVRGRLGLLRCDRFHQVDVHVQRTGMLRVAAYDVLGEGDDGGRARVRLAVAHPVAPRAQVHHRLDVEGGDVEVVGELRVHGLHGVGIRLVVGVAALGLARVPMVERLDERTLAGRRLGAKG
jgi:hypothetical protein